MENAIDRLYDLNVGTTPLEEGSPHERPHKPLLLLAAFDLIDEGLATPERIPWCQELRDRFTARFLLVRKHNDQNNPDLPFRYLAGDGFWQAFEGNGSTPIRREIRVADIGQVFARFTDGFEHLAAIPATRQLLREAILSRYFPNLFQIKNQQSEIVTHQSDSLVAEEPLEYGRSPAFRRKILEIYDHQCAACGLRIRLPSGNDVSFIDAAHLIPFSEYRREDAKFVTSTANFKIVKAHHFLGKRTETHRQEDGRILVFDEAQRTYEKGKVVLREKLPDHEADLILETQKNAYPKGGAVVVALIGHNQAINGGEMGIQAWLDAIERKGWSFSISDVTLKLAEIKDRERWANHRRRRQLQNGHLSQSMRYYRNAEVEQWAGCVMEGDASGACAVSNKLDQSSDCIWITRSLSMARNWAKKQTVGTQRCGLIASGQARRLAAEGLFVELKPNIADWMLAPSSDVRSSNALEAVQNQFQVQGLELDFCVVCWDIDLRRESGKWKAYKLKGSKWQKDSLLDVAKNSYRVLLTRARKGMIIFVPYGDLNGHDETRNVEIYDGIWRFLLDCGAKELVT